MGWRPAKSATPAQAERAKAILHETIAAGTWREGVLAEEGAVQYRGAQHPNYGGQPGTHPGVEVWVQSDSASSSTSTSSSSSAITTTPWKPDPKNRASAAERELVLNEFEKRGWPRDEADAMVSIESGWDPTARNVQGFSGLIGFGPWFVKRWGLSRPIWQMSAADQAPLVGRYLDEATGGKRWRYPGDTYMTGAAPAFIGASDSTVVYPKGSKAWEQNRGWRPADDGDITAGSIRATLLRRMAKGGSSPTATPKPSPLPPEPEPDSPWPSSYFWSRLLTEFQTNGGALVANQKNRSNVERVVRTYQHQHGLRVDGLLGAKTLERLLHDWDLPEVKK